MKILLTGSTGFIGRNLREKLQGKYELSCPYSYEIDLKNTEAVKEYLKKENFDIVIHAANVNSTRNKETTMYDSLDGNLRMFFNLERCKEYFGRMYYFGSGAEYDRENYLPNMKEEYFGKHVPKDAYGFSKYIMSRVCEQDNNIYDLRLFGVYGKYEEWERRFISNAICKSLKGMDITIQKNVYFDYLWVDDLCNIMEWFIENTPQYKHYNVCTGSGKDLYFLACTVKKVLKKDCNIIIKEKGWKPEYTGNNERLIREVGDFSFEDTEKAILKLYEYYKKNLNLIDESKLI